MNDDITASRSRQIASFRDLRQNGAPVYLGGDDPDRGRSDRSPFSWARAHALRRVFIEEPGITGGNTSALVWNAQKLIQAALDGEQAAAC